MILSALAIVIVLAIAYIWASRGFFSALIHLVCVLISGAIAFAVWEPVTYAIMNADSSRSAWLVDLAWGLGLAGPFAISLAILRLGIDALLPNNADLDGVSNLVGGGVCGILAGVITSGIFIISLGYLRFETSLMGYEPFGYDNNGSIIRNGRLLLPVDRLTAGFYSSLSNSTFSVEENMAKWHPNLADEGPLLRVNYEEGKSRHTMKPDSFEVFGRYTVETTGGGLLNDSFSPKKYTFTEIDKEPVSEGNSRIDGFVVKFNAAANEKSGRILVGNSQMRLIVQQGDKSLAIHPISVISEGEASVRVLGRWMFDSQKVFISTVQGRNEVPMAFEFLVPKDSKPLALYAKGMRFRVDDETTFKPFATYKSTLDRDNAIRSGQITPTGKVTPLNFSTAFQVPVKSLTGATDPPILMRESLPGNFILQKDDLQGLEVDEARKIISGEAKFQKSRLKGNQIDRALQVRNFSFPEDQLMVQVIVDSRNTNWGFISNAAANMDQGAAPVLVDENGARYPAYGYVYETSTELWISYTPQSVISSVSSMPSITKSNPNVKLTLLYRIGKGVNIKYFAVGETALADFVPKFEVKK